MHLGDAFIQSHLQLSILQSQSLLEQLQVSGPRDIKTDK